MDKQNRTDRVKALEFLIEYSDKRSDHIDLRSINLAYTDLTDFKKLTKTNMENADFTGASLLGANLKNANLLGANLTNAQMKDADLTNAFLLGANLKNAYLLGANLTKTNMENADFTGASLLGANLKNAYLLGANLTNAQMKDADLTGASLLGANLKNANLLGANLTNALLLKANLKNANLLGANLTNAQMKDADLTGASLLEVNFSETKFQDVDISGAIFFKLLPDLPDGPPLKAKNLTQKQIDGTFYYEDSLPICLRQLEDPNTGKKLKLPRDVRTRPPKSLANSRNLGISPSHGKASDVSPPRNSSLTGEACFDYSSHNGCYIIGQGDWEFETMWTKASQERIYTYNDRNSIDGIALVDRKYKSIRDVQNCKSLDFTSRVRTPALEQIVVLVNKNGFYAAIQILGIKDDTRGDGKDELHFRYAIQSDGTDNFSNFKDL